MPGKILEIGTNQYKFSKCWPTQFKIHKALTLTSNLSSFCDSFRTNFVTLYSNTAVLTILVDSPRLFVSDFTDFFLF